MLSLLFVGGDYAARQKSVEPYLQPFQVVLDGAGESLKIEHVRELIKALSLTNDTTVTHYHLILEAQALTIPAQQALLKTLEEPPANTQIILTANTKHSLLPTILSRVMVRDLPTLEDHSVSEQAVNDFLRLLKSKTFAPLINLASALAKDDPNAFVEALRNKLRSSLPSSPTLSRVAAIKHCNTALEDLNTNMNRELVLCHLFLVLYRLSTKQIGN